MEPVSDRQLAAVPARTRRKYGARAEAFAQLEAGHAAQNILLQAAALGLAAVPVGSLNPSGAAAVLALPPDQTVLYLIPVGRVP
jgi:nitroreductase